MKHNNSEMKRNSGETKRIGISNRDDEGVKYSNDKVKHNVTMANRNATKRQND